MIKCTVCQLEKEDNNFQTYWHSTQNKMRIRKQCTLCYYTIRLKRKNPDLFYENNPDYRKCRWCGDWKTMDNYYIHNKRNGSRVHQCKTCIQAKEKVDRLKEREIELQENCGSDRVKNKPNVYGDKYQKACTFSVMEALQYIYDEATGIWYKPGFKEIVDGKAFFPTILKQNIERYKKKDKVYTGRKPVQKMTKEKYIKLFELRDQKKSYAYISDELDIAMTTVYNYLNGIRVWKDI